MTRQFLSPRDVGELDDLVMHVLLQILLLSLTEHMTEKFVTFAFVMPLVQTKETLLAWPRQCRELVAHFRQRAHFR